MNFRIVEKEAFRVAGVKTFVTTANGENFKIIPGLWDDFPRETLMELAGLSDQEPSGILGVCADMYDGGFDYWIAAATSKPVPAQFSSLDIPAATWAVFEAAGPMPGAIQALWGHIYNEWFPSSGYEHAHAPEIEWYSDGDQNSPGYKSAVWIPVVKK